MRTIKCGYCHAVVAELAAGTRIKPLTCMLCQACAKKVGVTVASQRTPFDKPASFFSGLDSIFGKRP